MWIRRPQSPVGAMVSVDIDSLFLQRSVFIPGMRKERPSNLPLLLGISEVESACLLISQMS